MKLKTVVLALLFLLVTSLASAVNLELTATWTPNTEPDMKEYRLYRTDGTSPVLIGTIPHPTATYDFTTVAPDNQDYTLLFVLYAVDTANNVSLPSDPAPFFSNQVSPGAPGGLGVKKKQSP